MPLLSRTDDRRLLLGSLVLVVVAVVGLYVVKWKPYFYKAIDAASSHSLGEPIAGEDAPAPSVGAALGYAAAYFLQRIAMTLTRMHATDTCLAVATP
jgi:hypothetical protein